MIGFRNLISDRNGAAAVEMVLVLPLLLIILLGSTELGRLFWSEHRLVKSVRDASVFASRQQIDEFNCGTSTVDSTVTTAATNLIRTGEVSGGTDLLPNWDHEDAAVTYTVTCVTAAGGTTLSGMYRLNGGQVPVLTINATLPYNSLMHGFGLDMALTLRASQQTAVIGG